VGTPDHDIHEHGALAPMAVSLDLRFILALGFVPLRCILHAMERQVVGFQQGAGSWGGGGGTGVDCAGDVRVRGLCGCRQRRFLSRV
jgi:hypothetical protein